MILSGEQYLEHLNSDEYKKGWIAEYMTRGGHSQEKAEIDFEKDTAKTVAKYTTTQTTV